MKERLDRFYAAFGDRGVMFIIFAFSVVVHALLSMQMELPAVSPDEIGVASIAAMYAGLDWSALMGQITYYYGYVQALFYAPLFAVFKNPYTLYKAMLVVNGVMISFIPLIAYHLASKLGVTKVRYKLAAAFCCGFYVTYIAHSKFIWNEAISSLLPWFMVWCTFMAWDRSNKYTRFGFSVLTGFMCAVCYGAHSRLIAVVIALMLTLIIAFLLFRERILNLPAFFLSASVGFAAEHFVRQTVQQLVWRGNTGHNTIESEFGRIEGLFTGDGLSRFWGTLFGHIYTFMTSTLGLGAMAVAVFIVICSKTISEWYVSRREKHEDGTRVYEPVKHKYSLRLTVFGIYAFFAVGGSALVSVLFKFNSDKIASIKDLTIFGRYVDNVAPLAVFLVLMFIFLYGYTTKIVIGSASIYAYACFGFTVLSYPYVMEARTYRESPVLGLMPWRIGEDLTKTFSPISFIIMSSMVFALFAALLVAAACSRRFKTGAAAGFICAAALYTTLFVGYAYLPMRAAENLPKTASAKAVSQLIYDDPQSPQIVAFQLSSRDASLIQFLNLNTNVALLRKAQNIPDSCLIIADSKEKLPFDEEEYEVIGEAGGLAVYARGEAARDYIRYKRSSDGAYALSVE